MVFACQENGIDVWSKSRTNWLWRSIKLGVNRSRQRTLELEMFQEFTSRTDVVADMLACPGPLSPIKFTSILT